MKPQTEQPKQGRITVKPFLNIHLKPTGTVTFGNGIEKPAYPLYVAVTYKSRNMQFKSHYSKCYSDMNEVEKGLVEFEKRIVTKIIRFEVFIVSGKEEYDLKGLKERYEMYAQSLSTCLEKYLRPKLAVAIRGTNNEMYKILHLKDGAVLLLYKAAGMLFENFHKKMDKALREEIESYQKFAHLLQSFNEYVFPTIIDWLEGSYKENFRTLLSKGKNVDKEFIDKSSELIDASIMKMIAEMAREYET